VEEDPGPDPDPAIADIIEEITQLWCVEDSELRKHENGFEWLPGSHAVHVGIARHVERPERMCICITTDYLRSVPVESADFVRRVALESRFLCSGYSLVYPPLDIWREYFDNRPANLELFSSAYVDRHTAGWLPGFLARMAIMQPINAENQSAAAPAMFGGGEPAYAGGEKKARISAMLFSTETVLAQEGQKDGKWIGSEEFRQFADECGWSNDCVGFGNDKGMTLETPFGADAAFIRFEQTNRIRNSAVDCS
jgi:hypothetical protein